ncbi:MAG: transglycosylase domain-containing protein [Clostridia bacterium]|nr:transglycosylase domain-containing protein [Clostridia bacterium]
MKWLRRILLFLILIVVVVASVFFLNGYKLYQNVLQQTSLADTVKKHQENKNYVTLDDVPVFYKNAVISVEDHRFYQHGPVDIIGIARAIISNVRYGKLLEGGSTITQQVAKNLYFITEESNATRKIAEFFMAHELEKNYKKDTILELYINTIYFGDGYYGIKQACHGYFDKDPIEMDLYESAMMAGVPNAPSVYAPTVNLDLAKSRQRKVVSTMVENGYLSQEEADAVLKEQEKR